jgi:4-aminobutyrate aminotransferase
VVPPPGFLPRLRQLCDEYGLLLIADEVQSGFGRTGRWFAVEHTQTRPDIMIMAKGMASGLPLSGIAAPGEMMAKWTPGSHGGTYGGNAVACAAAVATIQTMREEKLVENSAAMGQELMTGLRKLQEEHDAIGDVRGLGLMVASEFTDPDGEPWSERAATVAANCHEHGLMLLTCGPYGQVVRWIPPLVVNSGQIQEALSIFDGALRDTQDGSDR